LKVHPFLGRNVQCQDTDTRHFKDITELINDENRCNSIGKFLQLIKRLIIHFVLIDMDGIEDTCSVFVCPYPCSCFNGVVDCKDKDLIEIPRNIPDTTIELYCF
jgi:hypothetical protein